MPRNAAARAVGAQMPHPQRPLDWQAQRTERAPARGAGSVSSLSHAAPCGVVLKPLQPHHPPTTLRLRYLMLVCRASKIGLGTG